jgi:naringenin degradation protein FdeH
MRQLKLQEEQRMSKPVRRVVTGHNAEGKSIFVMDGESPHVFSRGTGSTVVSELWATRSLPAENGGNEDAVLPAFRLPPPPRGTVFRIIDYPPDAQRLAALGREREAADDGSGRHQALDRGSPRHPGFHKTNSVDYAIVLSGEIYALMDAGDVLIQRGTNHAWSNRSDQPARLAFVLVDAEPFKSA